MKSILCRLGTGELLYSVGPKPKVGKRQVLVATIRTLVSQGTEKMAVDFGSSNVISKALNQPERVRQVVDKAISSGIGDTFKAVRDKLDVPIELGYCNFGTVVEAGHESGFEVGDLVVSNGPHADLVRVSRTFCCKLPANFRNYKDAPLAVITAIALQAIRSTKIQIGESVAVIGTGLIGLVALQVLRSLGCDLFAIELNPERRAIASKLGAKILNPDDLNCSDIVDSVLVCASTRSSSPIEMAVELARERGRITIVGVSEIEISRDAAYRKELIIRVSSSYGDGRYNQQYIEGMDYPRSLVPWTSERNFSAALSLINSGIVSSDAFTKEEFEFGSDIGNLKTSLDLNKSVAIYLNYPSYPDKQLYEDIEIEVCERPSDKRSAVKKDLNLLFIGFGNYASRILAPNFLKSNAHIKKVVTTGSKNITPTLAKLKVNFVTSQEPEIPDDDINLIVIATRHNDHARQIEKYWATGKSIFVEKPICINSKQLKKIEHVIRHPIGENQRLFVGFNRRFSKFSKELIVKLSALPLEQITFSITINAGQLPVEHWVNSVDVGGGRLVSELCHFIDYALFLTNSRVKSATLVSERDRQNFVVSLEFQNGSIGSINYFTNHSTRAKKEEIIVNKAGKTFKIVDFKSLTDSGNFLIKKTSWLQDKGIQNYTKLICNYLTTQANADFIIPVDQIIHGSVVLNTLNETGRYGT